jgi:protein gp37
MAETTAIEWTDSTWNPILGCNKVSQGCKNCYAEAFMERFRNVPGHPFEGGFDLRLVPEKLNLPLTWTKPRRIFTCSMSDLFHEKVPESYIKQIFGVMRQAHWHVFQVLTKRSERLLELSNSLPWPENVWMGVSVEDSAAVYRAENLSKVPAQVRFLSIEPLIGRINKLPLANIDWVIVGGESGPSARPMELEWAREVRDMCRANKVAFFLKQLGGRRGKRGGEQAILDGCLWHQYPATPTRIAA